MSTVKYSFVDVNSDSERKHVCRSCLGVHKLCFTCKRCVSCCGCSFCIECLAASKPDTIDICNRCSKCTSCCICSVCPQCVKEGRTTSRVLNYEICSLCGHLTSCCGLNSNEGIFIHNPVNLNTFVPQPNELQINPIPRLASVEIEICGTNDIYSLLLHLLRAYRCNVVRDGSLPVGGFEINTHPAGGDLLFKMIDDICFGLSEAHAFVTDKAGCHMHIDARDFNYRDIYNLIQLYHHLEDTIYSLLPETRRKSRFCVRSYDRYMPFFSCSIKTNNITEMRDAIVTCLYGTKNTANIKNASRGKAHFTRYSGFNLHSWFHRGTIEFRHPPGMTSSRAIKNWLTVFLSLMETAKQPPDVVLAMLSNMPGKNLLQHIVKRQETLDWIKYRFKRGDD